MIELLIDRVGNTNVFNLLDKGDTTSHLQSIMDEDLILEYTNEINSISTISNSLLSEENSKFKIHPDILKELKTIGEAFFLQFFPVQIIEKLLTTKEKYLHFNIDQSLADVPWELLHDGYCFLSDKFFIGKTIKGQDVGIQNNDNDRIKMLIIADPTEDLEWAEKEGEILFSTLKQIIPDSVLHIELIGGKQVTKLRLLSLIKDKNIIHYSGHLFFSNSEPLENGWLLSNNKILKAREIKSSGFNTNIVFSNSCLSSKKVSNTKNIGLMNYFAGSFLMSGINCFIGTNREIADNQKTIDFTIKFYTFLFSSKSVGESLFLAKEYARRNYNSWDLTWANYSLHGTPDFVLFSKQNDTKKNTLNYEKISTTYPTPIAKSCYKFFNQEELENHNLIDSMNLLVNSLYQLSIFIGNVIIHDSINQSMGRINENFYTEYSFRQWWDLIFLCISDFKKLEISMFITSFQEIFSFRRESIYKMIDWIEKYNTKNVDTEELEAYFITLQYYYENILIAISEFEEIQMFYIDSNSQLINFRGKEINLKNSKIENEELFGAELYKWREKLLLYHKIKKSFLVLFNISILEIEENKLKSFVLKYNKFNISNESLPA